jgi:glucoamylase
MLMRVVGYSTEFSEQLDRNVGIERGAKDLTWSYGSFVTAMDKRQKVSKLSFGNC